LSGLTGQFSGFDVDLEVELPKLPITELPLDSRLHGNDGQNLTVAAAGTLFVPAMTEALA